MSLTSLEIQFNSLIESSTFSVEYDVRSGLIEEGLKKSDYIEICRRLNRPPNRTELGMFGVMWSEHCCYRNSKPLLENFPTNGLMVDSVGAFIIIGLIIWIQRSISGYVEN